MRTTKILLTITLAFKTIYSKAINNTSNIIEKQLNVDDSVELVKSDNFITKFHCNEEKEYCEKVKNEFNFVFDTLSNAFEFYQPVVFETYVDELDTKYGIRAYAMVIDRNFVSLKSSTDSVSYLYPQALSKQLNLDKEPNYKKNDFIMAVNSNPKYRDNEIRHILIHEMLHGLGFASGNNLIRASDKEDQNDELDKLYLYSLFEPDKKLTYSIIPTAFPLLDEKKLQEVTNAVEYAEALSNTEVSKFLPQVIFDKYLVSLETGEKLYDDFGLYHEELNKKCLPQDGTTLLMDDINNQFAKNCYEKFSPEKQDAIKHIVEDHYFKANSLGFLSKNGDIVSLQTFENSFDFGSSVSHPRDPFYDYYENLLNEYYINNDTSFFDLIDQSTGSYKLESLVEYYDDNYILYFSDDTNMTVEEMIELFPNNKKHPLIGDGIVNVLKTLGWKEKGEPKGNEIYYVDESIIIPEPNVFKYLYMKKYELGIPSQNTDEVMEPTSSNVGNTESNVGNTGSNVGNTGSNVGNTESNVGNTESNVGNTESNVGNTESNVGNTGSNVGNTGSNVNEIENLLPEDTDFEVHEIDVEGGILPDQESESDSDSE